MKIPYSVSVNESFPFNNNACFCIGTGRMGLALQEEYQKQLEITQKEIGFSHIRGHGLFTDDMAIYDSYTDENGTEHEHYNFTYLDRVFDSYLAKGLKPFIELGFMPKKLASGSQTIFYWQGNTTPPADWDKWSRLVSAFISHIAERYGRDEVRAWPCEVWNEPNLPGFWQNADREAYLKLYDCSVRAVKKVIPEMPVGGPAVCGGDQCMPWIRAFLEHCLENDVPVDFVSRHIYMAQTPERKLRYTYHDMCTPAHAIGEAKETRALIDSFPAFKGLPLHITEYNTSYNPRCPTHDTLYNAALICGMLTGLGDYCASYSYWTFGDVFEETGVYDRIFHGGFGLLADGGIAKPTFHAYRFFSRLTGKCIFRKDDAVFTLQPDGSLRGIVFNLCQAEKNNRDYRFSFDLPDGDYCAVIRTVDHLNGNPLLLWHNMGEPSSLTEIQKELLKAAAQPALSSVRFSVKNGNGEVALSLSPNAFCSVDILPASVSASPGYIYPEKEN